MATEAQRDFQRLLEEADKRHPGVADLMELYDRVGAVFLPETEQTAVSDSSSKFAARS